jgi:hypothetical protein
MTMVAFNLPSKLSQMVAFKVQSLFQALQSPYGSFQYSFQALQSPQELARTLSRVKTLLAKMNEMINKMREKGVNECFNLLPNPRLPFPCFISPKKHFHIFGGIFHLLRYLGVRTHCSRPFLHIWRCFTFEEGFG